MKSLLIISEPGDAHAHTVAEAFTQRGDEAIIWYAPDFPSKATETVHFSSLGRNTFLERSDLESSSFVTVWLRSWQHALDLKTLHQDDRKFADGECGQFRQSLLDLIAPHAFWVNPPRAAENAASKLRQHAHACEVGLATPETLYTNDPERIRGFLRHQGGRIVYKPLKPLGWQGVGTFWVPMVSAITEQDLPSDALLRTSPGIYQQLVPKDYELRIAVMGQALFAVKIYSQQTTKGRLDWRHAYDELRMEPFPVPAALAERCLALLSRLGLVFGCFDFIVTPDGQTLFLEVNEAGQFLFVEDYTDLSLLAPMVDFLRQGRPDFTWKPTDAAPIRHTDFTAAVEQRLRQARKAHVRAPDLAEQESPAEIPAEDTTASC